MFNYSPLLVHRRSEFNSLWTQFKAYKRTISTYGTILLDSSCSKILLCSTYDGRSWTFPSGKGNQDEECIKAAMRETYEETGFDIERKLG